LQLPPLAEDTIVYTSILMLFSLGLTLTYMTTKVPNFAHATVGAVGAYSTLTVYSLSLLSLSQRLLREGADAYALYAGLKAFTFSWQHYLLFALMGFALGSAIGVGQYKLLLKPLSKRGATIVQLMIATIAVDMLLLGLLNIYADKLLQYLVSKSAELSAQAGFRISLGIQTRDFVLYSYDYSPALKTQRLVVVAPSIAVALLVLLAILLYKTKLGVALRASIENPSLASAMGVNVDRMFTFAWALSLGVAGLAGSLMPLKYMVNPAIGQVFILSVFAASILGGLNSLVGAIVGGVFISLFEVPLFNLLSSYLRISSAYRVIVPLLSMAFTLLFIPNGLASLNWRKILTRRVRR